MSESGQWPGPKGQLFWSARSSTGSRTQGGTRGSRQRYLPMELSLSAAAFGLGTFVGGSDIFIFHSHRWMSVACFG